MKSRNLYALLVISLVIMASVVIFLRGRDQQATVLDVSNLNSLKSSYYVRLNNTIWEDSFTNSSAWNLNYDKNSTSVHVSSNGVLGLNASFASEPYPEAVQLYRSLSISLTQGPILIVTLEASVGIHYGIRIGGRDSYGNAFQAWSESSNLQHRVGLGQPENFTINPSVDAYRANGVFPSTSSSLTSLMFYLEATPHQTGNFSLIASKISVETPNRYAFDPTSPVSGIMDGILITLNATNNLGYSDSQFFQGYLDYYVSGSQDLTYTVYYVHYLTVLGQGFDYSSSAKNFNIAFFSSSRVRSYPAILADNNTYSILLAAERGTFRSFQFDSFSVRYLSQAALNTQPNEVDSGAALTYYLVLLFVTPVAIVVLVSKLFSNETKRTN